MAKFIENESGDFVPDSLVCGAYEARKIVVKSGAGTLKRGTVLGAVSADGKFVKSASAASDGSQEPDRILAEDVDATSADVQAIAFISGRFDQTRLILGAGHTLASIEKPFRFRSIYLENPMG